MKLSPSSATETAQPIIAALIRIEQSNFGTEQKDCQYYI